MWNCVSACPESYSIDTQLSYDEFIALLQKPKKQYVDDEHGT
jgi:hypothetical protein